MKVMVFGIGAGGIALAGAAAFALLADPGAALSRFDHKAVAMDSQQVARGGYLAKLGDCAACHTADGGKAMAGGRPLPTPFGTLYSTNITPDAHTGIGAYSFAQFDRAMRYGVAADGHNLYPVMPYTSFSRITPDDMAALYAWTMKGVAPVDQANHASGMMWPFTIRFPLTVWRRVFANLARFTVDPSADTQTNRGAYLVEGLGHCGACHTPRGLGFQEKTMDARSHGGANYLAGAVIENWQAGNLRHLWSAEDVVTILRTGHNSHATISGNMADVVAKSTQYWSADDLAAVGHYLEGLTGGVKAPVLAGNALASNTPGNLYSTRGGLGYLQFCASCHRENGVGVRGIFPPLAGNPAVYGANPATLIHISLTGSATAKTVEATRVFTMPALTHLSDAELAEIIDFVRATWGGVAPGSLGASDVSSMRRTLGVKAGVDGVFKTPRFADLLAAPNSAQLIRGLRLNLHTHELLPHNVGDVLDCTSCHLGGGTVAHASPYVGVAAQFPSYNKRAGRIISFPDRLNGCFRRSMNGTELPVDSPDMKAMVAYAIWMNQNARMGSKIPGRGLNKIKKGLVANPVHGHDIYQQQCSLCHGKNGEGLRDAKGVWLFPPVWGAQSYNIGAGIAKTGTAGNFVKSNMPVAFHQNYPLAQGGLSDQDALDVGAFFSHQPRPDFPDKVKDWPKDPKPKDARY